jgi:hypothetical protein
MNFNIAQHFKERSFYFVSPELNREVGDYIDEVDEWLLTFNEVIQFYTQCPGTTLSVAYMNSGIIEHILSQKEVIRIKKLNEL